MTKIYKQINFYISEILEFRYLINMLTKRELKTTFSQTILGVLWFLLVPLITTFIYIFIFGKVLKVNTYGIPYILFYLSGTIFWSFFSSTFLNLSNGLASYASLMSKVYFPRIIGFISILISGLIRFGIKFFMFILFWLYFIYKGKVEFSYYLLLTPIIIILLSVFTFSLGLIFASVSYKYKDFQPLLNLGMPLLMFITPVLYPFSLLPKDMRFIAAINPLTSYIEVFRYVWIGGEPQTSVNMLIYSIVVTFLLLFLGLFIFNKAQRNFVDSI